ncbi:MAG: GNAT family N-acetyltransferase [Acidimicrobiia bacterium]|nr:GNAT family N-acetyltransferase [Acidimicrobiia bacterium]
MPETPCTIRRATEDDHELVAATLYTALAWDPEDPIPPMDFVVGHPKIAIYHEGWTRPGDAGAVAEIEGAFVGMAYCRLFDADQGSQGFYDAETPELAVAVHAAFRGRGIGRLLIEDLHRQLAEAGVVRMSLSVAGGNPAARLYERIGYRTVRVTDGDRLMVADL